MFFIYGIRSHVSYGTPVEGIVCPHCGQQHSIPYRILKYFHFFWIPIFVYSFSRGIECRHCRAAVKYDDLNQEARQQVNQHSAGKLAPILCNFGLILILALTILFNLIIR